MKPTFSWRRKAKDEHTDIIDEQPRYSVTADNQQQLFKRRPSGFVTRYSIHIVDSNNNHCKQMFRITNDDRETEMENNLQQVNAVVSTLKHMAINMNAELNVQLPKIDRIAEIVSDIFIDYIECFCLFKGKSK